MYGSGMALRSRCMRFLQVLVTVTVLSEWGGVTVGDMNSGILSSPVNMEDMTDTELTQVQ